MTGSSNTPDKDFLTPIARKVLDTLGEMTTMVEWHPELSGGNSFVVVLNDESAARVTVEAVPDPGPIAEE